MPKRGLQNFSDLEFLQGIDAKKYLRPLFETYATYFRRQDLDIATLTNRAELIQKLHEILTSPDEEMPGPLLDLLYTLDDLADESGIDRIVNEAKKAGVSLDGIVGKNLSPGEFAILVHHAHPKLLREAHEATIFRKIRTYEEYQARVTKDLTVKAVRQKAPRLEEPMGKWFDANDLSPVCDIYAYDNGTEIHIEITHGRHYRTEPSIDKRLRRSRVAFRPQKHDSAIYDTATGLLKLSARTAAEKNLYRTVIGSVLFGDAEHFPVGLIYTLAPLKRARPSLKIPAGIVGARLTEIWIELDSVNRCMLIVKSDDVLSAAQSRGIPVFTEGRLVRAQFMVKYESGGRARRLEVRVPNVAIYDRNRDREASEAFLGVNGFLKRKEK